MSGSIRWFAYQDDSDVSYAIRADESNTELVNLAPETSASVAGLIPLPKGVTPRSVTLEDSSGDISRTCYVLTPQRYAALNNAINFQLTPANFSGVSVATEVSVVRKNPEIARRQPRVADSGLNDGDNP